MGDHGSGTHRDDGEVLVRCPNRRYEFPHGGSEHGGSGESRGTFTWSLERSVGLLEIIQGMGMMPLRGRAFSFHDERKAVETRWLQTFRKSPGVVGDVLFEMVGS